MAYVIAEPCIGVKDAACVDACPVDCIHPKKDTDKFPNEDMLYIDPVECIDCGACVPVCPVSAILALDDSAYMPRMQATGILAYSLRPDAVEHLERLLKHRDPKTRDDAAAAIDAISRFSLLFRGYFLGSAG